jgi:hypothetical protein
MPNSHSHVSRLELLVVLRYLLKYTDAQHVPQQKDYVAFAKQTYHLTIRRQRVQEILNFLVKTKKAYPEVLPFDIKEHSTGTKKKYYVGERYLKDEELDEIIGSVMHNRYVPVTQEDPLIRTILQWTKSEHSLESYLTLARRKNKRVAKIHPLVLERMKQLDKALTQRAFISFQRLPSKKDSDDNLGKHKEIIKGYVYKLIDQGDQPFVLIINQKHNQLESYRISRMMNLQIISMYEEGEEAPPLEKQVNPLLIYQNYLKEAVNPEPDGTVFEVTFQFVDTPYHYATISESFNSFFKQPMKMNRKLIQIPNMIDDELTTYEQITVTLNVNSFVFIKWVTQYEIARIVEVQGPQMLKDLLTNHYVSALERMKAK